MLYIQILWIIFSPIFRSGVREYITLSFVKYIFLKIVEKSKERLIIII